MCGTIGFSKKFMERVVGKTVKDFEGIDVDSDTTLSIIFTDDTKMEIEYHGLEDYCDFHFYKKVDDKWKLVGKAD